MSSDDVKALITEASEIAQYADEQGHHGVSRVIGELVTALKAATSAPAADREALRQVLTNSVLGAIPEMRDELHVASDFAGILVDALLASGILRDVRDVQAEALEQAAETMRADPDDFYIDVALGGAGFAADWLDARAQAIREARND